MKIKFYLKRINRMSHASSLREFIFAICYTSFKETRFEPLTLRQVSISLENRIYPY